MSERTWPAKGYRGPQPWELGKFGIDTERTSDSGQRVPVLGPGQRNTLAPVVMSQPRPILAPGSGGEDVRELCRLLSELDYYEPTGQNPFSMLGPDELAAVRAFRRDYGVAEDPSIFVDEADARFHVGPVTWEALVRAVSGDTVELPESVGEPQVPREDRVAELRAELEALEGAEAPAEEPHPDEAIAARAAELRHAAETRRLSGEELVELERLDQELNPEA